MASKVVASVLLAGRGVASIPLGRIGFRVLARSEQSPRRKNSEIKIMYALVAVYRSARCEIADAERDETQTLVHASVLAWRANLALRLPRCANVTAGWLS